MEDRESVLEALYDYEGDDIEMEDVEEGEIEIEAEQQKHSSRFDLAKDDDNFENRSSEFHNQPNRDNTNSQRRKNKKKRKRRGGPGPNVTDINRFVLDVCKRLKEKKSYMVYTAVGCLGVSRLSDLVKEVDAVQSCGGQMTADGGRFRTGGGVLWNILKTKEPQAYQEIMKKAKEFERQFKRQNISQAPPQSKETQSQGTASLTTNRAESDAPNDYAIGSLDQQEQSSTVGKHASVHERIRVPVSYDDLLGDDLKGRDV